MPCGARWSRDRRSEAIRMARVPPRMIRQCPQRERTAGSAPGRSAQGVTPAYFMSMTSGWHTTCWKRRVTPECSGGSMLVTLGRLVPACAAPPPPSPNSSARRPPPPPWQAASKARVPGSPPASCPPGAARCAQPRPGCPGRVALRARWHRAATLWPRGLWPHFSCSQGKSQRSQRWCQVEVAMLTQLNQPPRWPS